MRIYVYGGEWSGIFVEEGRVEYGGVSKVARG